MTVIPGEEQAVFQGTTVDFAVGAQKGDVSPYDAPFRHNPGTRITLKSIDGYTQPGLLKTPFVFPAPPLNQLQRSLAYNYDDYDTIADGQFTRPGGMALQTISFDTIIVADDYPWVFYNPLRSRGWTAEDTVEQLGRILRSGTPVLMVVEEVRYKPDSSGTAVSVTYDFGPSPLLQMKATLRTLTSTSQAGEPDALYVTVGFSEHRIPGTTQRKLGADGQSGTGVGTKGGENARGVPAKIGMAVFAGALGPKPTATTLQDLAVLYYGSAAKWQVIKTANPWLGNITATQDLGNLSTNELKAASKANRQLSIPKAPT